MNTAKQAGWNRRLFSETMSTTKTIASALHESTSTKNQVVRLSQFSATTAWRLGVACRVRASESRLVSGSRPRELDSGMGLVDPKDLDSDMAKVWEREVSRSAKGSAELRSA